MNLAAIPMLARELGCPIGYSDHTLGIEACVLAATLGACILEKHVTLAHDFSDFRDHQLSATPDELRELVTRRRPREGAARIAGQASPAGGGGAARRRPARDRGRPRPPGRAASSPRRT